MENDKNQWWGYLHQSGTFQAKRYFGPLDIQEAEESSFVAKVYGPFAAKDSEEALEIIRKSI